MASSRDKHNMVVSLADLKQNSPTKNWARIALAQSMKDMDYINVEQIRKLQQLLARNKTDADIRKMMEFLPDKYSSQPKLKFALTNRSAQFVQTMQNLDSVILLKMPTSVLTYILTFNTLTEQTTYAQTCRNAHRLFSLASTEGTPVAIRDYQSFEIRNLSSPSKANITAIQQLWVKTKSYQILGFADGQLTYEREMLTDHNHKAAITQIAALSKKNWASVAADGTVCVWNKTECIRQIQIAGNPTIRVLRNDQIASIFADRVEVHDFLFPENSIVLKLNYRASTVDVLPDGRFVIGKPFQEVSMREGGLKFPQYGGVEILDSKGQNQGTYDNCRAGTVLPNGAIINIATHQYRLHPEQIKHQASASVKIGKKFSETRLGKWFAQRDPVRQYFANLPYTMRELRQVMPVSFHQEKLDISSDLPQALIQPDHPADEKSIAIAPSVNNSSDEDNNYFQDCEGLLSVFYRHHMYYVTTAKPCGDRICLFLNFIDMRAQKKIGYVLFDNKSIAIDDVKAIELLDDGNIAFFRKNGKIMVYEFPRLLSHAYDLDVSEPTHRLGKFF